MLISYVLALFLLASGALAFRRLPAFHPLQLWCLAWAVATVAFCLRLLPYAPLSIETALVVIGATVAFAAGTLLGERAVAGRWRAAWGEPASIKAVELAAVTALVLMAIGALVFLSDAARSYGLKDALLSSSAARKAVVGGANSTTDAYLYASFAAVVLTALLCARSEGKVRLRWGGLCLVAILSTYLSTQRGMIFLAASAGLLALALTVGRVNWRVVAAGFAALTVATVAILMGFGALQGRGLETSSVYSVPSVFRDHSSLRQVGPAYEYLSAPLPALDDQVEVSSTFGRAHGCATFRVICTGLEKAGFGVHPEPVGRPFTSEPLTWNTYTSLDMPLIDGGRALFWLVVGITGFVAGALWGAARRGSLIGQVGYPLIGAATLFATWQNVFFEQLFLGAAILALLLTWGFQRWRSSPRALLAR